MVPDIGDAQKKGRKNMKILSFGSLNIDTVYHVDHIVMPGETISSSGIDVNCGGKGLNQSIALSRAGAQVWHAGMVGDDGAMLLKALEEAGVNTSLIRRVDVKSGNALIQVDAGGQNSIVLFGGANRRIDEAYIREVLEHFDEGDVLLIQNEISSLDILVNLAAKKGMKICFNPSPMEEQLKSFDYSAIDLLFVNEVEGGQITGKSEAEEIIRCLEEHFPQTKVVLTLGSEGAVFSCGGERTTVPAFRVQSVDTTAAGDTFTGYFITLYYEGSSPEEALRKASAASAIAVSRPGASVSIPGREEMLKWLESR